MKTKLICFILVFNFISTICYASNTVTIDNDFSANNYGGVDTTFIENMEREEYENYINDIIEKISSNDKILIQANSLHSYFYLNENTLFAFNNDDKLNTSQKVGMYDLLMTLYDSVNKYATRVESKEQIKKIVEADNLQSKNIEMNIRVRSGDWIYESYEFGLNDEGIITPWGHYISEEPQKIITEIDNTIYKHKESFLKYSLTSKTVNPSDIVLNERLEFEIEIKKEHEDTILIEFGEVGDVLKCTVEQVSIKGSEKFIFTINGDKGTKSYYTAISGLDLTGGNAGNSLEFRNKETYDDGILYNEHITAWKSASFIISGTSEKSEVTDVFVSVESRGMGKNLNRISTKNITYEYFYDVNSSVSKRSLHALLGVTKEDLINKAETENNQQDPTNYVTEMRGVYEDGEEIIDFYFSFVAEADIEQLSSSSPEWFEKLGNNVKATIVGVTQTLNGKDRRSYTMIRFTGDNGIKWFDNNVTEPGFDEKNNEYSVYNSFDSLTSFNGFQKVKNTKDYESTSATLYFNNDENRTLNSILSNVGNNKIKVLEKDIKYIGGGKIAYEKLW